MLPMACIGQATRGNRSPLVDKLEDIERQVTQLSPEELDRFRKWFADFDAAAWDAQIERDAAAGRIDALAAKALQEHHAGRTRPL